MNEIIIPNKVRWRKPVSQDPLEDYTAKQRKRIRTVLKDESQAITTEIVPLTYELVEWFTPLYEQEMSEKHNPNIFNVRDTTIDNPKGGDYWMLKLLEHGETIGASIFSEREEQLNLVYRFYPKQWQKSHYGANPSLFSDYILTSEAARRHKGTVSHGMDRNPYGINASIGLAIFKLAVGCAPFTPKSVEYVPLDMQQINEDALIFLPDTDEHPEGRISNAILFCSESSLTQYEQITKYPERVSVEVRYQT